MASVHLPLGNERQVYLTVSAIFTGALFLPREEIFQEYINDGQNFDNASQGTRVPSFTFLIQHPNYSPNLLFGLGLRKV